jgi:hypothetical protein
MAVNLSLGGYVEEIIFRGFLFQAMAKDNLRHAIIVSAITFGAGHIVNVFNTADIFGVLLQVCYAIAIGFLYTVVVYLGGSLWPCIVSHMFVNGSSVFAQEEGLFTSLVSAIFNSASPNLVEACSAVLIIFIAGAYALWLWKKKRLDRFGQAFCVRIMLLSNKSNHTPHWRIHHTRSPGRRWGAMGAPPVAESSDLSEWQRSADDEAAPSARKMPGTATGEHLRADTENESFCVCPVRTHKFVFH